MTIKTTIVATDGAPVICDTIEHEGSLWLVTKWKYSRGGKRKSPERMIQMPEGVVELSKSGGWNYHLEKPILRAVLDGSANWAYMAGYVLSENPEIQIDVEKGG